jgi:acyl-CoA reductase-like NAD-dependent aldehyde dehydrogenase
MSRRITDYAYSLLKEAEKNSVTYLVGANNFIRDTRASLQLTIIINVKARDKVYTKETFGPSATLYVVKSKEGGH